MGVDCSREGGGGTAFHPRIKFSERSQALPGWANRMVNSMLTEWGYHYNRTYIKIGNLSGNLDPVLTIFPTPRRKPP